MAERASNLIFLKIGGSVLGDKRRARSFRAREVERLGREVSRYVKRHPRTRLLLAHGGGPMAHAPAARYRTRDGLAGGGGWEGFAATRRGVLETNARVLDALARGGLRPVLIPPVAGCMARDGRIARWDTGVIRRLLNAGEIPLIHGDAVLDEARGFTILSTEELFAFLAPRLKPARIIMACDVPGFYVPGSKTVIMPEVKLTKLKDLPRSARTRKYGGKRYDVTGGMASKLTYLSRLARCGAECRIVSGLVAGCVEKALEGKGGGTRVC